MQKKRFLVFIFLSAFCGVFSTSFAQPAWTIDLLGKQKKPEKFENRKLGSEKMADKKFTPVRRLFQNTYTHYNYFYNANNKINSVIETAKYAQVDDLSKLLSYQPYSLDNTASQATELDSVIFKTTAGILLHDLRSDWVDNMYLLMGQAYFLRKNFDSAAATFQFINYNLAPRKRKDDDDDKVIGTNYSAANNTLSIANKEKRNFLQKVTSKPPSRNDAILWLVRTLIEQDEFAESAGLIKTLQKDPNFPKRLENDLNDLNAYLFYKQGIYDSAAHYLEKGLSVANTKQDKARSQYLLAQLFELTKQYEKASTYYSKASKNTTSPLMDIYANLNKAKMNKGGGEKELDNSISNLLRMAKKDKFEAYKDIILFSAGELALQKPDTNQAILFYNKSLDYNEENISYKNKAFLRIADIAYDRKDFKTAFANYDSLQSGDTALLSRINEINQRRNALMEVVALINIIEREDSLQRIAALPLMERDAFLKKLSRKLRKEKGLSEEEANPGIVIGFDNAKDKPVDLFGNANTKGDWYFYNSSLKSKGFNEFKSKWGKRNNVDNWRRKQVSDGLNNNIDMGVINPDGLSPDEILVAPNNNTANKTNTEPTVQDVSYDGLLANLPLSEEKMLISQALIASNLFDLAKLYQNKLEEYEIAITTYYESLKRFPDSLYNGELYMGLYYCYNKLGITDKANHYKNLLLKNFTTSRSAKLFTNPSEVNPTAKNEVATKRYENIYTQFIEGNFSKALSEKKMADSVYGVSYWSPQLLYIESVYHIKEKNDSAAIHVLNDIIELYPTSPLKPKSETMIEVLGRRAEIEKYLTELEITRAKEDDIIEIKDEPKIIKPIAVTTSKDSVVKEVAKVEIKKEEIKTAPQPKISTSGPFVFDPSGTHNIIMVLNKVDPTYINEAKNAFNRYNQEKYRSQNITITKSNLDADNNLLVFASFPNAEAAMEYLDKVRRAAPSEISWLPANKYSFIISDYINLDKVLENKDLPGYINLLKKQYPDKF